jgi:hypothetical protein
MQTSGTSAKVPTRYVTKTNEKRYQRICNLYLSSTFKLTFHKLNAKLPVMVLRHSGQRDLLNLHGAAQHRK